MLAFVSGALVATTGAAPAAAQTLQKGFWGPAELDGVSQLPLYRRLGAHASPDGSSRRAERSARQLREPPPSLDGSPI